MLSGQPIIILRENVEHTGGSDAQRSNIMAAKAIASAVRTTLGPRGMDKMLTSESGTDIVITNDGATILHEISVQHPGGKLVVEVAEAQDDMVGDGTTTACILVGELMEAAGFLLEKKIHPTVVAKGYQLALDKSLEIMNSLAISIKHDDRKGLMKIANTAMTGKSIEGVKDKLAEIIVDAVLSVSEKVGAKYLVDEDDVMIKTRVGENMDDAELLRGVVIGKKRADAGMPKKVENARIALLSAPMEIKKTEVKAKIKITDASQMTAFDNQEKASLKAFADKIKASGANVLFCQKGIADAVQFYLAKYGIYAVEDVPEAEMKQASRAIGAQIVTKVDEITPDVLGEAEIVEEMHESDQTVIRGCKDPKQVTILLHGSTQVFLDELERAVYDAARVVMDAVEDGTFVVGGGSVETELSLKVREYAATVGGREQLAIEAFAGVFEAIPRTLAENSGYDPVDKVVELKNAHATGNKYAGLDVYTGEIIDMKKAGVFEPLRVKTQAIKSAAETASLLIRVDDMMVTKSASQM